MEGIVLSIVTPKGAKGPYQCDSVHLSVADDDKGKGGGNYGIRKGHASAMLSLEDGTISGYVSQEIVIEGKSGRGFATVEKNQIVAIVESFEEN